MQLFIARMLTMVIGLFLIVAMTYVVWFVAALTVLFKLIFYVFGLALSILIATAVGERYRKKWSRRR